MREILHLLFIFGASANIFHHPTKIGRSALFSKYNISAKASPYTVEGLVFLAYLGDTRRKTNMRSKVMKYWIFAEKLRKKLEKNSKCILQFILPCLIIASEW